MARPKWRLSEEDYFAAYDYCKKALTDDRFEIHHDIQRNIAAEDALKEAKNAEQLQGWIDTYLNDYERNKLRSRLRVAKSRKRLKKHVVELPEDEWRDLRLYAQDCGMTIAEAVRDLLQLAKRHKPKLPLEE